MVESPFQYDDIPLPATTEGTADAEWNRFFEKHRPYPIRVRQGVMKLHREKQHKTVIACLQAAMIHGQAQPWMYEVLALSMEIEDYPKGEIERVVLSLSDFGAVTFENLMYSAAYLKRFDRKKAALALYQQSSRISPERHEPYMLGLPLADEIGSHIDVQWASEGILQHYWGKDYSTKHRNAEDAVFNRLRILRRDGQEEQMKELASGLKVARSRDLAIRVEWSGTGDLDLQVEEPPGSICSFEAPLTYAGGIFLHDGAGPDQQNCFESYVCPSAVSGPYRITVKNAFGNVVGDRAVVTVIMHQGTPEEEKLVRTLILTGEEASFTIDLVNGRRTQPRNVSFADAFEEWSLVAVGSPSVREEQHRITLSGAQVLQDYQEERIGNGPQRAGAVGFAPVIQTIPEGSTLSAQAIVSPDRRYVRLAMRPNFTTITDVFTFSYLNNGNPNGN